MLFVPVLHLTPFFSCSASSDDSVPSKEEPKEQVEDSQEQTLSIEFLKETPPPAEGQIAKPHGKAALLIADQPKPKPPAAAASAFLQNVS